MDDVRIPSRVGPKRVRILQTALAEWDAKVREVPLGSNRGPRVDDYLPAWSKKPDERGPAWCAFFAGWVLHETLGEYLPGGRLGNCSKLREAAQRVGRWVPKHDKRGPIPGDVFIMDTDGDAGNAGHTGFVLRVSEDGVLINTVEGNCGQRVQLGIRTVTDIQVLGWINTVPGEPSEAFERGLIPAKRVGKAATR